MLPALIAALLVAAAPPSLPRTSVVTYGLFGNVTLVEPAKAPSRSVLVIGDRGGADGAVHDYVQGLAENGSLVIGVDLDRYLASLESLGDKCSYPAGHVEELAHWMERHVNLPRYQPPYVVGFGTGADFAYALAAQAPSGTFSGVAMLGYDFDFRLPKPFCTGDSGSPSAADGKTFRIVPVTTLPLPWLALPFAPGVRANGLLGGLRETFAVPTPATVQDGKRLASALDALARPEADRIATDDSLSDLPLTEIAPQGTGDPRIAIMLSGDGGWAGLDKGVAAVLAQRGVRVVGLSSLQFFWRKRTPVEITSAVGRIIAYCTARYPRARFVLIGYSFGAGLVPVVGNRLQDAQRARVAGGVMISPDDSAVFEIKIGDWFGNVKQADALPLDPELAHAKIPLLCISGKTEEDAYCPAPAKRGEVRWMQLPGGHHYNGDYDTLGAAILAVLPR